MMETLEKTRRNRPHIRPNARGPRPQTWITGTDPLTHEQYTAWLKHRAQAHFRNEEYSLTFEDWSWFWNQDDRWSRRGRSGTSLCLTRIDHSEPWSRSNCLIITRQVQMKIHNAKNTGKKYKKKATQ